MIKKPYSLFLLMILFSLSCREKEVNIKEYYFLSGKWNSAGTDSYEYWEVNNQKITGLSLRMINNSLEKIDSMLIEENKGKITMTLHLKYSKKEKAIYELVRGSDKQLYFKNDTIFPNQISYSTQKGTNNLIVKAGEDIFNHKKDFEFLYVPMQQ